ncbi:murein biosynthesis integral membrane protein MurJ [Rickettsiales bacterium]|nr:murein biosynthesis integral membrane protein MurJ [Rickettsiales bacterium]
MFLRIVSIIGSLTFLSRVLGYIRDFLMALVLGASYISDAFFVAFKLPNLFRRLFAEGAMNSAFIPVISGVKEKNGKEGAGEFLSEMLSIIFSFLLFFVIIFEIFMPYIIFVVAPGFEGNPSKFSLTVQLSRLTFPFLLFICLSSLIGGYLNTISKFAAMAFTPVILNLSMLTVLLLSITNSESQEITAKFLASSISIAGVIQLIWLFYHLKVNKIELSINSLILKKILPISVEAKKLFSLFLPAAIGNGVYQINLLIDMILASTLPDGSISFLYFADRINQLPLGVLGIALSTALLPILSKQIKKKQHTIATETLNHCLQIAVIFSIPASAGLIFLSEPIISVLFVRGEFTSNDALLTSHALIAFCIGLPAFIFVKIFATFFFAREDTKTPVYIAILAMFINLALNLILIQKYFHVGLALATSISSWFNCSLLYFFLRKNRFFTLKRDLILTFFKSILSSLLMIISIKFIFIENFISLIEIGKINESFIILSMAILFGSFVYIILIYLLGIGNFLRFSKGD